ncbi:transporter substrate-binding domain-containing protein [Vibrio alginolyticus]|nr:transporter substrate-binding domain-containing protein [Vibrio alginolyticus]
MKWIVVLFISLFSVFSHAKEWKQIRFTVEGAYPPFSWTTKEGKLEGFEVDLANALCKELEVKCVISKMDWDGIIPSLLSRKNDAIIAAMTITEEREKKVDFTVPYAKVPTRFVMKNDREINMDDGSLNRLSIGVQRTTIGDKYLSALYPDIDIRRYGTFDEAFTDLLNGRLDAVFGGSIGLSAGFLETAQGEGYHFTGPAFTEEKWFGRGIGVAVRKQDKELKALLDSGIQKLIQSGKHKTIASKYFSYSIYE